MALAWFGYKSQNMASLATELPSRSAKVPRIRQRSPRAARGLTPAGTLTFRVPICIIRAAMAIKRDYYEILGVPRDASDEEIKRAFRRAAQRHHPDIDTSDGAEERFKELNEAYRVLSDRQRRTAYDMFGHAGVDGGQRRAASRDSAAASGRSATSSTRSSAAPRPAPGGGDGSWPAPTCATT